MLTVRAIRDRVVAHLGTALGSAASPWHLSRRAYDEMDRGAARDPIDVAHQSYAVATPRTIIQAGRQRRDLPQHVGTQVHVRWLYRLRPEDHDGDYADALDAEAVLLRAVLATPPDPQLLVQLDEGPSRRTLAPDTGGYVLGEMHFVVYHGLALNGGP